MENIIPRPCFDKTVAIPFPKIEAKTNSLLHAMRGLKEQQKLPAVVPMEGTVKLHGIHADIIFDLKYLNMKERDQTMTPVPNDNEETQPTKRTSSLAGTTFQSRNRTLSPTDDLHGWPCELAQFPSALTYIRDKILTRFLELNPKAPLITSTPLIIAGEWIGRGVQKNVGIQNLDRGFVILSININGVWQKDADYGMIQANKASVYSIFNVATYEVRFDTSDLSDMNVAWFEMQELADDVEFACPFAARFGFPGTPGEGIVWKLGTKEGRRDPKCWVKTKGPVFGGAFSRLTKENAVRKIEKDVEWEGLVEVFVTDRRVEQGFEFLIEMGIVDLKEGQKVFCEWMVKDILVEEKYTIDRITEADGEGATRRLKSKVWQRAYDIYQDKMKNPD